VRWKPLLASAAAIAAVLTLGLSAAPASASSASYEIIYESGFHVQGEGYENLVNISLATGGVTDWEWINEGGDCLGQTCWMVRDDSDGYCLDAVLYVTSFNLIETNCDASDAYELFTNPPTVSSVLEDKWGKWYNEGVSTYEGADWACIANDSNGYLYVEGPAITGSYDPEYVYAAQVSL
jgi:hypothetical protein